MFSSTSVSGGFVKCRWALKKKGNQARVAEQKPHKELAVNAVLMGHYSLCKLAELLCHLTTETEKYIMEGSIDGNLN